MRFGEPFAFWFMAFVPLLFLFYAWGFYRKKRALAAFGNPSLVAKLMHLASRGRQWARAGLMMAGFLFLTLSLVQPQFGTKMELIHRRGVDLVIALDTSLSMLAEDIRPNRLTRARYEIADLIDRLQGDRVGLIAFAGRSHVLCPLTLDYGAAKLFLGSATTDLIPVQGTALADAMQNAIRAFGSSEGKYQALILITDGENHVDDPIVVAQKAAESGVRIFVVGVGTPDGELIPIRDGDRVDYLKDQNGNIVKTRLDEVTLRTIAEETGGLYVRAGGGRIGLQAVYEQISQMEKRDLGARKYSQYKHRFQWPLGLALLCFLGEAFLSDRRREKQEWRGRFEQ